jgi:hypothetical protein
LDGSPRTLPSRADEAGGTAVKFYELRDNLISVAPTRLDMSQLADCDFVGLEPISPELVLVDPELRAIALSDLQAHWQSTFADAGIAALPTRTVSSEATPNRKTATRYEREFGPPLADGSRRATWARWITSLAVLVVFGGAGYVVSAWTAPDAGRSSVRTAPSARPTVVGTAASLPAQPHDATRNQAIHRVPKAASTSSPRSRANEVMTPPTTRTFVWPRIQHAAYYEVRFFRNGRLVFEAWPSQPRLQLPSRWLQGGHARRLVPGPYAWRVFPVFGSRAKPHLGAAIVRSRWVAKP